MLQMQSVCQDWTALLAPRLVQSLDATSVLHFCGASMGTREAVSTVLPIVVAVIDEDTWWARSEAELYRAAADLAGTVASLPVSHAGGWAFPWQRDLPLPRCIDWRATPWRLACSSLERLAEVEGALRAELQPQGDETLSERVAALGAPWRPLQAVPPSWVALPQLRRVCVSPAVAAAWPPDRLVGELLIQGPLAEGAHVRARGVSLLRLAGTAMEDLQAVQGLAPGLRELEVSPTDFECPCGDTMEELLAECEEDEPPRLHVSPDPAHFGSLQRLQARLDAQSLVILGSFAKSLPLLRRLGTLEVSPHEISKRLAWLPKGLEECVLAVFGKHPCAPSAAACVAELEENVDCGCLHFCFVPDDGESRKSMRLMREAESTPLDRPLVCS